MLTITISTGGSAFEPTPEYELARILRKCVAYLEAKADFDDECYEVSLMDINGNKVGTMKVQKR